LVLKYGPRATIVLTPKYMSLWDMNAHKLENSKFNPDKVSIPGFPIPGIHISSA